MTIYNDHRTTGYIAITSMLVIAAVVLVISVTIALVSINEGQVSLAAIQSDSGLDITEACVEETLLQLNETNTLPATVPLPQGTCTVSLTSHVGNDWSFTVSATIATITKTIAMQITRGSTISITSWQEM